MDLEESEHKRNTFTYESSTPHKGEGLYGQEYDEDGQSQAQSEIDMNCYEEYQDEVFWVEKMDSQDIRDLISMFRNEYKPPQTLWIERQNYNQDSENVAEEEIANLSNYQINYWTEEESAATSAQQRAQASQLKKLQEEDGLDFDELGIIEVDDEEWNELDINKIPLLKQKAKGTVSDLNHREKLSSPLLKKDSSTAGLHAPGEGAAKPEAPEKPAQSAQKPAQSEKQSEKQLLLASLGGLKEVGGAKPARVASRSNSSSSSEDFGEDDRIKIVDEYDIIKFMGGAVAPAGEAQQAALRPQNPQYRPLTPPIKRTDSKEKIDQLLQGMLHDPEQRRPERAQQQAVVDDGKDQYYRVEKSNGRPRSANYKRSQQQLLNQNYQEQVALYEQLRARNDGEDRPPLRKKKQHTSEVDLADHYPDHDVYSALQDYYDDEDYDPELDQEEEEDLEVYDAQDEDEEEPPAHDYQYNDITNSRAKNPKTYQLFQNKVDLGKRKHPTPAGRES